MESGEFATIVDRLAAPRPEPERLVLPSVSHPDLTLDDAYAIQRTAAERREVVGNRVVGRKVGLATRAAQAAVGAAEPIAGRLHLDGLLEDGAAAGALAGPGLRVECELAFLVGRDIAGPGITGAHVLDATAGIAAAFEVIEDRLPEDATVVDMVADNCAGAGALIGSNMVSPLGFDLVGTGVVLEVDGELAGSGASGAVMGNPARSVAWLANRLGRLGEGLRAGELVLVGALLPPVDIGQGRDIAAVYGGGLGSIRLTA